MFFPEYEQYDALGLAELVRGGEMTPFELLQAALERAEAYNPKLNAITHFMIEEAKAGLMKSRAKGPFYGVPFLLKDITACCAGVPTSCGSRWLKHWTPEFDTTTVARYKAAGLVVFGKTNTPEFGTAPVTEPVVFGPCRNPWNLAHTPGGSSGGSAAAVASGIVPMAHATDGAGSIRIPAACCGLFGFKPSRGLMAMGPVTGKGNQGLIAEGVITTSVRDAAAMLDASCGSDLISAFHLEKPAIPYLQAIDTPLPKLKIGICLQSPFYHRLNPECEAAVARAARLCRDLGHEVIELEMPYDAEAYAAAFMTIMAGELGAMVRQMRLGLKRGPRVKEIELVNEALLVIGRHETAEQFANACRVQDHLTMLLNQHLQHVDMILSPTLACPPLKVGEFGLSSFERMLLECVKWLPLGFMVRQAAKRMTKRGFSFTPFTPMANMAGLPAMSVPLAKSEAGLPLGCHFMARLGGDTLLLQLAAQLLEGVPIERPQM